MHYARFIMAFVDDKTLNEDKVGLQHMPHTRSDV